jgi:hypothetical protein
MHAASRIGRTEIDKANSISAIRTILFANPRFWTISRDSAPLGSILARDGIVQGLMPGHYGPN